MSYYIQHLSSKYHIIVALYHLVLMTKLDILSIDYLHLGEDNINLVQINSFHSYLSG